MELTGQNLIWAQGIVLPNGLLTGRGDLIASAVAQMATTLQVTDGEGIQDDFSFHQHGALLYTGGYGAALVEDASLWVYLAHDTPWAFPAEHVRTLTDYLLDGVQWAVHGASFDFTTMGRNITRAGSHYQGAATLRAAIDRLLAAGAPRRAELAAFGARRDAADSQASPGLVGCRYYPRSDYLVHRRPGWSVSVRMSSSRTVPTESMNGENLRGRHLGDGVAAIRVGDSSEDGYREVIPVWDWARLPGITAEQPAHPADLLPRPNGGHGACGDVAGWSDGRFGIAVMRLAGTDGFADGWKAWFCLDDVVVALGAGISAPTATRPVVTTVDQRLGEGPISSHSGDGSLLYAHHGRIGYVPLSDHGSVFIDAADRSGSWSEVTASGSVEAWSARVFCIGFDHGRRPQAATYACLILPGADPAATAEWAAAPDITIVANTAAVQAVRCHRSRITLTARHDAHGMVLTSQA